jgi:hypothetical protein
VAAGETRFVCEVTKLSRAPHLQFGHEIGAVSLDRALASPELVGDLLVCRLGIRLAAGVRFDGGRSAGPSRFGPNRRFVRLNAVARVDYRCFDFAE